MMTEDLYTGKLTIRQLRKSYLPDFHFEETWDRIIKNGGPGTLEHKNYLMCTSNAFCVIVSPQLARIAQDPIEMMQLHESINEYCRRYPLTMLIRD